MSKIIRRVAITFYLHDTIEFSMFMDDNLKSLGREKLLNYTYVIKTNLFTLGKYNSLFLDAEGEFNFLDKTDSDIFYEDTQVDMRFVPSNLNVLEVIEKELPVGLIKDYPSYWNF